MGALLLFALVLAGARLAGAADDWGLLLGLRQPGAAPRAPGEAPAPDRYRTLWLTPSGTSVKTVVLKPLLVPRTSGFWEVGSQRLTVKAWQEDEVYAVPVGREPPAPEPDADPRTTSGFSVAHIQFAGPLALSLERHGAGYTEGGAHPWETRSLQVVSPDRVDQPLSIGKILGVEAVISLRSRAERYLAEHPDQRERLQKEPDKASWGLVRRRGSWIVRGLLGARSEVDREAYATFDVGINAPARVAPDGALDPPWTTVFRHVPGALDAFSSPHRDIIGVVTPGALMLFRGPADLQKNRPMALVDLEADETPVMIRWASGATVARWSRELERAAATPARGATVPRAPRPGLRGSEGRR